MKYKLNTELFIKLEKYIDNEFICESEFDFFSESLKSYEIYEQFQSSKEHKKVDIDKDKKFKKDSSKSRIKQKIKKENIDDQSFLRMSAEREVSRSLDDLINERQETFSQSVLKFIDAKGVLDSDIYKKVFIDRRLFSKIRSDSDYKPSKNTAIALAVALELKLDECLDLIGKAGFTLSFSSKFDLIIRYFIENKIYNILEINAALDAFGQGVLSI
ncbi:MAG: hypothetical protein FWE03_06465 [Firmicutes bacterium]|nr:hypothetical protein [Bacillota bacterium]